MPNTVTSVNMGMVLPVVSVDPGPDWATRLFTALFTTLDLHDHSSGKGVQIQPAGLNVSSDLTFGSNNATALRTTRYTQQAAPLALGTDVGCAYDVLGELYWNNASGVATKITNAGAVNATITTFPEKGISGNYTLLAADPFELYYVNLTSVVCNVSLPAASTVAAGKFIFFTDINRNSVTNALNLVPNGTDKINTVNSTFAMQSNGGTILLTSDGSTNWYANALNLAGGVLSGPVTFTNAVKTTTYTIDSGVTGDYYLFLDTTGAAFNVTLPTPTAGRTIILVDKTGNFGTNALTLVRHGAESINGVASSKVLSAAWAVYTVISDGTNWYVRGS